MLFRSLQQLEPGVFTARWRTVSNDGHVIGGGFTFGVGAGTRLDAAPASPEPASTPRNELDVPLRWLTLIASALVAGGFWFRQLVLNPAAADLALVPATAPLFGAASRRVFALIRIAAVGLLVLGVITLFNQAAQVSGTGLLQSMQGEVVARLITKTRYGLVWLARMMILVGLLGVIEQLAAPVAAGSQPGAKPAPPMPTTTGPNGGALWWWAGGGLSLALLFTGTLVSHAATRDPALLSMAADFAHQAGAAAWLGGLFCLAAALRAFKEAPADLRTVALGALLSRFGRLAVVAVVVVLSSGWQIGRASCRERV